MTIKQFLEFIEKNNISYDYKICYKADNEMKIEADAVVVNPDLKGLYFESQEELRKLIKEGKAESLELVAPAGKETYTS